MSRRFRRGLVVGKFCPLHLGHESVIARALAACEDVIVISYTKPDFERCPREARQRWLSSRFPGVTRLVLDDTELSRLCAMRRLEWTTGLPPNDAPEQEHREFVAWLCTSLLCKTVEAVFTSETYGDGFAAALTDYFRARVADAPVVQHVSVDLARTVVPVSGTDFRANPQRYREFLAPEVYADFVHRVCLLGGESSGKTTLAERLAQRLNTIWVPEYGRDLWEQKKGVLGFDDMLHIGSTQVQREIESAARANGWLFCDTSPLTTLFYSIDLFGKADPRLQELSKRRYDHVFLCVPDFDFVQDGTRRQESFRVRQHDWYLRQLTGTTFSLVEGPVSDRLEAVLLELDIREHRRCC